MRRYSRKRGTRFEVSTMGFDPALALIQGNPWGTPTGPGLIIPGAPPSHNDFNHRYLFMLAQWKVQAGEVIRLVGIRQLLTLGSLVAGSDGEGPQNSYNYVLEQPVTTSYWHFSDANVSWHLRWLDLQPQLTVSPFNAPSQSFRMADNAALLFEDPIQSPGGYRPPYGGQPPGVPLVGDLGAFQDIRFPWQSDQAWDRLDHVREGPGIIALFASVQQTNSGSRPLLTVPGSLIGNGGLTPEETFIANFTNAVYYRIAGSLIFEVPSLQKETANQAPWCKPVNARGVDEGCDTDYHPPGSNRRRGDA